MTGVQTCALPISEAILASWCAAAFDVTSCLRAAAPLIKLLRMVDADNPPSIGVLYDGMNRAKERI